MFRTLARCLLFGILPAVLAVRSPAAVAGERSLLFDEGRDYRHCASMCLQLAMQAMRHEDRGEVDPSVSVRTICANTCQPQADRENLSDVERSSIMVDTLEGLQKPPSWGLPGQ